VGGGGGGGGGGEGSRKDLGERNALQIFLQSHVLRNSPGLLAQDPSLKSLRKWDISESHSEKNTLSFST